MSHQVCMAASAGCGWAGWPSPDACLAACADANGASSGGTPNSPLLSPDGAAVDGCAGPAAAEAVVAGGGSCSGRTGAVSPAPDSTNALKVEIVVRCTS